MANVTITQLPAAGAITGDELVPIVQNGVTVHTTTGAIAASPSQTQTFLTLNQEPTLPNSRRLSGGLGIGLIDSGAQSTLQIVLNAVSGSLETQGLGLVAKTSGNTTQARQISVSGAGLSVNNGDGVSGDPTLALSGLAAAIANLGGSGLVAIQNGTTAGGVLIAGTSGQISVANGNGSGGNPTVSIADNPVMPGTAAMTAPIGSNSQRPVGTNGMIRYNSDFARFEVFQGNNWEVMGIGDGSVTEVFGTGNQINVTNATTTPVIAIAPNPVLPGNQSVTMPVGSTAQRPAGAEGMFRYNTDTALFEGYVNGSWQSFAAGSGVTSILTGTGLTGGPITTTGTISIANTGVTANTYGSASAVGQFTVNAQGQLTSASNVSISIPASAINTTIPNSGLTNSSITIGSTSVSLGGTITTLAGTSISGSTNTLSDIGNASLTNSSITINGSSVSLGGSVTVTATASNALTIGTGLTGTSYNGSTAVTIAIDSTVATLTGTQTLTNKTIDANNNTLSNIPNSSLTNSQITLGTTNISLGGTSLAPAGLTSVTVTQNPTSDFQLATKQYVDNLVATGTTYHDPVYVESPNTAGNLNATYSNGTAGVGATLTNAGTLAALTLDGILMTVGKRVLIYNQTNQFENGVYTVTTVGDGSTPWVLTRATDADSYGPGPDALDQGSTFFVQSGNTGAGETYTCTTVGTITFGVTAITFSQIGSTQVYSAGTGLTLSGTQFSISNTAVTAASYGGASKTLSITVNAQGQLTFASETNIAIDANQITSGTIDTARVSGSYTGITGVGTLTAGTWNASAIGAVYGGTGLTSYTAGDLLYASGSTTVAKLGLGTSGYVLTAGASAPQYTAQSSLDVGNAANVTTTAVTANSTYYPAFMPATSGSNGVCVDVDMTYNPSTNTLTLANLVATSGISGGTF